MRLINIFYPDFFFLFPFFLIKFQENGNLINSLGGKNLLNLSSPLLTQGPMSPSAGVDGVREVRPPKLQSFKSIMDRMSPDKDEGPTSPGIMSPDKVCL